MRSFALYIQQMQNPAMAGILHKFLQTCRTMIRVWENGTVFVVDGVLRVPVAHQPYAAGVLGTGQVGTVTVTA